MRSRIQVLPALALFSLILWTASGYGQDEQEKKTSTLTFEAGSNIFKRNPDDSFINRLYRGVTAWHLDAELTADEGVYMSDVDDIRQIRFYGSAAFRDSVRHLNADTLIYFEDTREARAIGNVTVTEGGRTLRADHVRYLKDLRYIEATGSVTVNDDSTRSTITGEKAVFNDSTGYGLIIGDPYIEKEDEDGNIMTVTCQDSLELFQEDRIARLWNNVTAFRDSLSLSCSDTLEIADREQTVRLWHNVTAKNDSLTALSDHALYSYETEALTLTGNPEIRYAITDTREDASSELRTTSVVAGDSVRVFIHDRKVSGAEVIGSATGTTTSVDTTGTIFDQSVIESADMRLEMEDGFISLVSAEGTARSYYHRNYADDGKMFVNDAVGDTLTFYFDRGKITEMKIFGFGGGLGKGIYYNYEEEESPAESDSTRTAEVTGFR